MKTIDLTGDEVNQTIRDARGDDASLNATFLIYAVEGDREPVATIDAASMLNAAATYFRGHRDAESIFVQAPPYATKWEYTMKTTARALRGG